MNINMTVRTYLVAATIAAASLTLTSCGDELQPPPQDIGVELPEPATRQYEPACNTRAAVRPCPDPTYAPNRQKIDSQDSQPAPNRQKIDSEFAPAR